MDHERFRNQPASKARRRELRARATPAEVRLWMLLKGRALRGRRFRRQYGIDSYVLDFYCPEERLAVELDGAPHSDPLRRGYDLRRQLALEALGIRVLRFENHFVFEQPEIVLIGIASQFRSSPAG